MTTILAALFVFGILVTVHEFGHFITAKLTGMRVDEFAIGFGPNIFQKKYGETLYSLRAFPLGGYNKIAGMEPDEPADEGSYKSKPIPSKMLVILAGSLMNFVLPIILFTGIFCVNGINEPVDEPVLGIVMEEKAAGKAGLVPGDKILAVGDKKVATWSELVAEIQSYKENEITLTVLHEGNVEKYTMKPEYDQAYGKPLIGISPKVEHKDVGFFEAIGLGVTYTKHIMGMMLDGLRQIVFGDAPAELSGPIGIAKVAGEAAEMGMMALLNLTALLSINLGIINLLPLPALDGGHFVLLVLEAVRGKPLGADAMNRIQTVGMALILGLTAFAIMSDLSR